MVQVVRADSDVQIGSKYGKTVTYEVVAADEFLAEQKVSARAAASSPLSTGAIEIVDSERLTERSAPLQEFRIKVFIPNETIVQRLGADRAKDGLRALGILSDE